MLEGFALSAAFNHFPEGVRFCRCERTLEIQIQLHSWHFEQMREKQFGLQARGIHAAFGEEVRTFLNRFQDGHGEILNSSGSALDILAGDFFIVGVDEQPNVIDNVVTERQASDEKGQGAF